MLRRQQAFTGGGGGGWHNFLLLTKYYSSGQIEEDGRVRACGTYGEENRIAYRFRLRNRKERDRLEDVGVDGKVIKCFIKDQEGIKQPELTLHRTRKVTAVHDFSLLPRSS
jgi:hypothetical protein